jgi:hypothetical protein
MMDEHNPEGDIDHWLGLSEEAWRSLPQVEREIDDWNPDEAVAYLAEWAIQEDTSSTSKNTPAPGK